MTTKIQVVVTDAIDYTYEYYFEGKLSNEVCLLLAKGLLYDAQWSDLKTEQVKVVVTRESREKLCL